LNHNSEKLSPEAQTLTRTVKLIVSGGQTGADRAALDWAIQHKIPHRGWCPFGRKAEDGRINDRYNLQETTSDNYAQRTEWNVFDSGGTVIFSIAPYLTEGSELTRYFAEQYGKPYLHIHKACAHPATMLLAFLRQYNIYVLNIAGPRATTEPGVGTFVTEVLDEAFDGP
jgi:Circularly permutated YpsA SLOG family